MSTRPLQWAMRNLFRLIRLLFPKRQNLPVLTTDWVTTNPRLMDLHRDLWNSYAHFNAIVYTILGLTLPTATGLAYVAASKKGAFSNDHVRDVAFCLSVAILIIGSVTSISNSIHRDRIYNIFKVAESRLGIDTFTINSPPIFRIRYSIALLSLVILAGIFYLEKTTK